ncbi:MAG: hypothetical protein QMD05_08630 [Candidatus Brocadiaceae bacterium]|nr:hypothetical protein [Candidatus Brocadiaceae bacterium]
MKESVFQDSLVEMGSSLTKEQFETLCQRLASTNGDIQGVYKDILKNAYQFNAVQIEALVKLLKGRGISKTLFLRDLHKQEKEAKELMGVVRQATDSGKKDSHSLTAYFPGLIDLVEVDGKPVFLALNSGGRPCWNERAEVEGQEVLPPPPEHLPWLLPRGDEVLKHYKELEAQGDSWVYALCGELFDFLYNASEMPSDDYYHELLVPWILHTYLLEHFHYSPILCLYAVPERGKSRTGKTLAYLSCRGAVVESLRESNIIRLATDCRATIFFDCMGFWRKVEKNQSEDVILARCERGSVVPRVLFPERGPFKDTKNYQVFGPTILATNESIHEILETRAVMINMPEASRTFTQDVTPELALPLKEKLTAFRAYYLEKAMPEVSKPAPGRLGDILKPLYQVIRLIRGQEGDPSFLEFVAKLDRDRRLGKSDTLEAQVVRAVLALEGRVERGILPVKTITETINRTRPEGKELTPQRVGRRLDALGFDKGRTGDGHRAIIWDGRKISLLQAKYGLQQTSDTSDTSDTSGRDYKEAEATESLELGI